MKKLIIASNNKSKIAEIAEILGGYFEVVSMKDAGLNIDIEETGVTFEQNAVIKAKACFEHTGLPSLADDSGLEVEALNGAPGVYSADYATLCRGDFNPGNYGHFSHIPRFGGIDYMPSVSLGKTSRNNKIPKDDQNIDALLSQMKNFADRRARFVCVMALCNGGDDVVFGKGMTEGRILSRRTGTGGFGYDPIFWSNDLLQSFGEASPQSKNKVSHRRRALDDLLKRLPK